MIFNAEQFESNFKQQIDNFSDYKQVIFKSLRKVLANNYGKTFIIGIIGSHMDGNRISKWNTKDITEQTLDLVETVITQISKLPPKVLESLVFVTGAMSDVQLYFARRLQEIESCKQCTILHLCNDMDQCLNVLLKYNSRDGKFYTSSESITLLTGNSYIIKCFKNKDEDKDRNFLEDLIKARPSLKNNICDISKHFKADMNITAHPDKNFITKSIADMYLVFPGGPGVVSEAIYACDSKAVVIPVALNNTAAYISQFNDPPKQTKTKYWNPTREELKLGWLDPSRWTQLINKPNNVIYDIIRHLMDNHYNREQLPKVGHLSGDVKFENKYLKYKYKYNILKNNN